MKTPEPEGLRTRPADRPPGTHCQSHCGNPYPTYKNATFLQRLSAAWAPAPAPRTQSCSNDTGALMPAWWNARPTTQPAKKLTARSVQHTPRCRAGSSPGRWLLALTCQCPAGPGAATAGGRGSWRTGAREGRPHPRSSRGTAEGTFSKDTRGQQGPEGLGWRHPPAKGFTGGGGGEEVGTARALSLGQEPRAATWPGSPSAQLGITPGPPNQPWLPRAPEGGWMKGR